MYCADPTVSHHHAELRVGEQDRLGGLVGAAPAMRDLYALIQAVAPSPATVLIRGESGSGKEVVARTLHELSGRRGPLVAFDAASTDPEMVRGEAPVAPRYTSPGGSVDEPREALVVRSAPRKSAQLFVLGLVLVVAGLLPLGLHPGSLAARVVAAIDLLFLGPILWVYGREAIYPARRVQVDKEGLRDETNGLGTIPWEDLTGFESFSAAPELSTFLMFDLRDPEAYLRRVRPPWRWWLRATAFLNRLLGYPGFMINLAGVDRSGPEVLAAIEARLAAARGLLPPGSG